MQKRIKKKKATRQVAVVAMASKRYVTAAVFEVKSW
jgi:hypothetical protein